MDVILAEATDVLPVEDDLNELTLGERLAILNQPGVDEAKVPEKEMSSAISKLPSADSVHVLLRQALRAEDRVLLLDCLQAQDEKVRCTYCRNEGLRFSVSS